MVNGKSYWLELRAEELKVAVLMLETYQWSKSELAIECYEISMRIVDRYLEKANECNVILNS